jgi:DtxR family transcriptional regulator, Mn-dependent transcriptional regulator
LKTLFSEAAMKQPINSLAERYGTNGHRVVLYAGTFEPYQGLDLLVEAARGVVRTQRNVRFFCAGGTESQIGQMKSLAQQLGIAAPSVSAMLGRLEEMGFVEYERYRGVRLTEKGEREALRLIRRHRLIETFLIEHLGYAWEEVHHEAEVIEHVISDTFTERLAALLGHPSHDPHGDPIPSADGTLPDTPNTPLAELEPGEALRVSRLITQDSNILGYLAKLGIQPGRRLAVSGREPLGGLVHIEIEGERQVLSKELAMLVRGDVLARETNKNP